MPLQSFKTRALLLKTETTEGTDSTPVAATDAFQILDGTSGLTGDKIERPLDRPYFTNDAFAMTNLRGFIEGGFEIAAPTAITGTATDKAAVDALLRIAGMAKTVAVGPPKLCKYSPVTNSIDSASAYFYHAGTYYKILGARAAISELTMEIGSYLKGKVRIEGQCQDVLEAALPAGVSYTAFNAPQALTTESMAMSVNGFMVEGKSLSLDFGTEMGMTEHTEARLQRIRDRKASATLRFYRPAKASLDPWALWKAGTIVPCFSSVLDAGGVTTTLRTLLQFEDVNPVEIDGDYAYEVKGRCIASSAGGDEFSLEFSKP